MQIKYPHNKFAEMEVRLETSQFFSIHNNWGKMEKGKIASYLKGNMSDHYQ